MFFNQLAELYNGLFAAMMICYMIYKLNSDLKRASFVSYIFSTVTIMFGLYLKGLIFPTLNMPISISINILLVAVTILVFHKYNIYHAALTGFMSMLIMGFADVFLAVIYAYPLQITLKEYRSNFIHITVGSILMFIFVYSVIKLIANNFVKARRRLYKKNRRLIVLLSANLIAVFAVLSFVYSIFRYYLIFGTITNKSTSAYLSLALITSALIASIACTLYFINYFILNNLKYDRLKMNYVMDVMTDTLNRVSGLKFMEEQLALCKGSHKNLAICFIDINNLKVVNDMLGHRRGDELIKVIVETIRENIRDTDVICRLGGDEFIVIFPGCDVKYGEKVMERINEGLKELNLFGSDDYTTSISYGFSEYGGDGDITVDGLLDKADQQMYLNKRAIKAMA